MAAARSTSLAGSQPSWTCVTATVGGSEKPTVSVASAARSSRDCFWAVSCSISPRTPVSWAWTSRMSGILVAFAMIAWRADSVARRFTSRAPRSTTWLVTSSLPVCSSRTLAPTFRSAARVDSQRSTGIRKVTMAPAFSPSPWRCDAAT